MRPDNSRVRPKCRGLCSFSMLQGQNAILEFGHDRCQGSRQVLPPAARGQQPRAEFELVQDNARQPRVPFTRQEGDNAGVGGGPGQFRNDVGIEKEAAHAVSSSLNGISLPGSRRLGALRFVPRGMASTSH